MSRVYYNKLVRDRIKEKIEKNGESCEIRVLTDTAEFEQELLKKVKEEANEVASAQTKEEFLAEYADLMVVLDALTAQLAITEADIRAAVAENVAKKGLYALRHFLHWSDNSAYTSNENPQGTSS